MIKRTFILFSFLLSFSVFADNLNEVISSYASDLVKIIGEELIARYGDEYACYVIENQTNMSEQIINKIKNNELGELDCFSVVDYFGDEKNRYEPNRDFNMSLMSSILTNCNDIMSFLDKEGGVDQLSLEYFKRNSLIRYSESVSTVK